MDSPAIAFSNLCVLGVLCANPFRAGESARAKLAKIKGIKHDEFARAEKGTGPLSPPSLSFPHPPPHS